MPHNPSVFLTVLARFRVEQHIVDPMTRLSGAQQVVAIEIPRGVHTEAGITPSKLRVMVGYRVAVLVDDEDVPLAVNTLLGVVVGDCTRRYSVIKMQCQFRVLPQQAPAKITSGVAQLEFTPRRQRQ